MQDSNWELINGDDAHHIEFLNYANQVNVIEALFRLLTGLHGVAEGIGCNAAPNGAALRAIHHAGTLFLLKKPGDYRECAVHLFKPDGTVVYDPPVWAEVPKLMAEFETTLQQAWKVSNPVEVAAYCLWRINWIHPFVNGNGRAARAFAYACLCLKFGFMLPGQQTVIDLIMTNKPEFEAALRHADETFAAQHNPDLAPLNAFVERLLIEQLVSIPAE